MKRFFIGWTGYCKEFEIHSVEQDELNKMFSEWMGDKEYSDPEDESEFENWLYDEYLNGETNFPSTWIEITKENLPELRDLINQMEVDK